MIAYHGECRSRPLIFDFASASRQVVHYPMAAIVLPAKRTELRVKGRWEVFGSVVCALSSLVANL